MQYTTVKELKKAVDNGVKVYHHNTAYEVIKDDLGQYFIHCTLNGYAVGLTWRDNKTLNGKIEDFYSIEQD
jgi:3-methyladenine DNA glycosylase Tag